MKTPQLLLLSILFAGPAAWAETIYWYSVPMLLNQTSTGQPMTRGFSFELGVFKGSFVPSAANTAQWAANWAPAQRVTYNETDQRYVGQFTVVNNTTPFSIGKAAYVWGFQGGLATSEWVLFRATPWTWPAPNPYDPIGLYWNAAAATPVIGTVNASGSPHLLQSAAVTDAVSPATTWLQWQTSELAGEPLNGPTDDPDHDGTVNLLEFVFGSPPQQAGMPPQTPVALVNVSGQNFLQLTIPRRSDHPATLTVQVSSDLIQWTSGASATVVVSDTPAALVVRDLTPLGGGMPPRFIRLKAALP